MSARIRVVVAEDSPTMRGLIVEALRGEKDMEVVGEASDGRRAIELCLSLRPDAITMDMMMPVMNGLSATEYIMAYRPTPILIVSASTNRGNLFKTYDALAAGALDMLEKPSGDEPPGAWEAKLASAVRLVSRIKVITHPRLKLSALGRAFADAPREGPSRPGTASPGALSMVGIGASTGGPAAVAELLKGLPADFPVPILLVIHIGQSLGSSLAEWLNDQSPIPVRFARDAQPLPAPGYGSGPPGAFMAPGGRHLLVESGRLQLSGAPERFSCRPSVDALFESMAREAPGRCAACLLTGMGQDGAAGLLALRRAGAFTIAQDEASSAVFGMPKEAVALGAARRVLPLGRIAGALAELALGREGPPWD